MLTGKRVGAGRKKGTIPLPRVTPEIKQELREVAREHAEKAIRALVKICETGKSESARVAAASALLDRGYGKPGQHIDVTGTHKFSRMSDEELLAILEEPLEIPAISNGKA